MNPRPLPHLGRTTRAPRTRRALPGLVASGALLLALASPQPAQAAPPATNALDESVQAFLRRYLAALEARDEEAIRDLYVPDDRFAWYTDGRLAYESAEEVLAGLRSYADLRFTTEARDERVLGCGDTNAAASFLFRTRLDLPDGGMHEYGGAVTLVLEREAVAAPWRVVLGHTSTPGAPPGREDEGGDGSERGDR